jgi:sugar lactone lactonase YvrE
VSAKEIPFSGTRLNAPACTLGEGPTYDPHTGTAWWFDILGRKLFEYDLAYDAVKGHDRCR